MYGRRRPKFTLMPLIALGGLSLAVTVPILSSATVRAAAPVRYSSVVVQPGDDLWSLAVTRTPAGGDVQAIVDEMVAVNHLGSAELTPGQRIQIPQ